MSSNEEYLEKMLQAVLNGETLTGEESMQEITDDMLLNEPEQASSIEDITENGDMEMEGLEQDLLAGLADMIVEETDSEQLSDLEDAAQDELGLDGMILEEPGLSDMAIEESNLADIGLEGLEQDSISGLEDMTAGESDIAQLSGLEDGEQDELGLDGVMLEEFGLDDMTIEEPNLADIGLEGLEQDLMSGLEDMTIGESESEQINDAEDILQDELDLDSMMLAESDINDMTIEETGLDDIGLEGLEQDLLSDSEGMELLENEPEQMPELEDEVQDEPDLDSLMSEEAGLEDIPIEDVEIDDIALEESNLEDMEMDENSPEDLAMEETNPEEFDGVALEESDLDEMSVDFEAEENEVDEELSEIHDMLGQSGQDEDIDDEMLALLESVSDSAGDDIDETDSNEFDFLGSDEEDGSGDNLTDLMAELEEPQEEPAEEENDKKKKKEKKRRGKKAKADGEGVDGGDLDESEAAAEKKPGFFAKLLAFLTETDEDEEGDSDGTSSGEMSDENKELLNELDKEDKKAKKEKKGKKEKKAKKNKKADGEGGEDEEGGDKAAKKKKPKKEKKVKEVDEEAVNAPPDKKLSKKKIIPVILFCVTITAAILIMSSVVPNYLQKQNAHVAFDMGNYDEAFELLYGKNLNEDDEEILHKSTLILMMNRKLQSYQNYLKMGDNEIMALDALMQGVVLYYEILPEAEQYNVTNEIRNVYLEILDVLSTRYGLSETYVIEIAMTEDNVIYTDYLTSIIYGIGFGDGIGEPEYSETESPETLEDILPEELEIIDGQQNDEQNAGN